MNPLAAIQWIVGLGLASLLFAGGWSCSASRTQDRLADTQRVSDARARALRASARSFDAFAGVFRAIDAHTRAEIDEARRRERIAQGAAGLAAAAEASAMQRSQVLARQLTQAKARSATCRVVMETDLDVCGVTLR